MFWIYNRLMNEPIELPQTIVRTLRLRVKDKHAPVLRDRSYWVNQVWNFDNELSVKILQREHRFVSGYDLHEFTAGASKEGIPLHSQTIQAINEEYATRRKQAKKAKLRWRVSNPQSSKYSLGWVPFKAAALRYRDGQVFFAGIEKPISLWDSYGLKDYAKDGELGPGCFCEDARGRWYLCLQVTIRKVPHTSSDKTLGIDLGCKTAAVSSAGHRLTAKHYHKLEDALAKAQRARKKARVRSIHAKIKHLRKEAMHQFTTALIREYGAVFIGDVSTNWQLEEGNGKSVLDAGWGMLKTQLQYKGEFAGRWVEVVDERWSTQRCSKCHAMTGPKGAEGLSIRQWTCSCCHATHDRDENAAENIRQMGLVDVELRVAACRLEAERKVLAALQRLAKRQANKARKLAGGGHAPLAEGILSV